MRYAYLFAALLLACSPPPDKAPPGVNDGYDESMFKDEAPPEAAALAALDEDTVNLPDSLWAPCPDGKPQVHVIAVSFADTNCYGDRTYSTAPSTVYEEPFAGDSVRTVLLWEHPNGGKADSVKYMISSSRAVKLHRGNVNLKADTPTRRKFGSAVLADTIKWKLSAFPTATFQVSDFIQCRGGLCTNPGSIAWTYNRDSLALTGKSTVKVITTRY